MPLLVGPLLLVLTLVLSFCNESDSFSDKRKSIKTSMFQTPFNVWRVKREDVRNIKLVLLVSFLTIEGIAEAYVRIPQSIMYGSEPTPILDRKGAESVAVIFPGAGGVDSNILELSKKIESSDQLNGKLRFVKVYDWKNWRNDFVRIAFDGQAVGRSVCTNLADEAIVSGKPIKELHSIGISVGSFAADSCIKAYNQRLQSSSIATTTTTTATSTTSATTAATTTKVPVVLPTTRLTLLDPFTSKGVFGYGWGIKNFGRTADLAIDYYNSDDPVPTTNDPLELAYNYDLTNSKAKALYTPQPGENYHSWPVAYLASNWMTEHVCQEEGVLSSSLSTSIVSLRTSTPPPSFPPSQGTTIATTFKVEPNGLPQSMRPRGAVCRVQ